MLTPELIQYFMQNYSITIIGFRARALTLPTMQYLDTHPKTAWLFFSHCIQIYLFNAGLKCAFPNPLSLPLFYVQGVLTQVLIVAVVFLYIFLLLFESLPTLTMYFSNRLSSSTSSSLPRTVNTTKPSIWL